MEPADNSTGTESGRWKSGSAQKPIRRGFVKDALEAPARTKKSASGQRRPSSETTTTATATTTVGRAKLEAENCAVGDVLSTGVASPSAAPSTRAAANLQAAIQSQSRESNSVESFLAELRLDRYVGLFMEHGFDCIEVVREMEESHMREIGMATGHILKLKKHLSELNGTAAPKCSAQALKLSAGGSGVDASTTSRVSFGSTETREAPTTSCTGTTSTAGPSTGAFNEEESAASFQEALRAWRSGSRIETSGSPGGSRAVVPSSVGASTTPHQESKGFCLAGTQVAMEQQAKASVAPGDEKLCCYHCYKQFYARHAVEGRSPLQEGAARQLCSEACAERWKKSMELKAEGLQKRQNQVERMKEMQRALAMGQSVGGPIGAIDTPVSAMATVA
eukprot:TRINITY_DN14372_c0_g2_i1.p1 TRINITY_DN14372_c0_g2~~TRINITY_DN14372_c0_g2_i1.p1  ORF type:complete len:406 (-),score=78.67 TRINITY_DN14372_c0_g2_i1:530-1708(-)